MDNKMMEQKVKELKRLREMIDELSAQKESIEQKIKDEMVSQNVYEFAGEGWKVTWNMVPSNRFDQSSFKSEHPDMFEQYKKLSESRRFLLS